MTKVSREVQLITKIEQYKEKDLYGGGLTPKEIKELRAVCREYSELVAKK